MLRTIKIQDPLHDLVCSGELAPGVFVANTAVSQNNPVVRLLNVNDHPVLIEDPKLKTTTLNSYNRTTFLLAIPK